MNFRHLVERGKYSKEDLTDKQKMYVEGMEVALDVMDCNIYPIDKNASVLEQLVAEIKNETVEEMKAYLYSTICEAIVCFSDENFAEKENKERSEEE